MSEALGGHGGLSRALGREDPRAYRNAGLLLTDEFLGAGLKLVGGKIALKTKEDSAIGTDQDGFVELNSDDSLAQTAGSKTQLKNTPEKLLNLLTRGRTRGQFEDRLVLDDIVNQRPNRLGGVRNARELAERTDARLGAVEGRLTAERTFQSQLSAGGGNLLCINDTAYFVFLKRLEFTCTPKYVRFLVRVVGGGAQTAEVGLFSSQSPPNAGALDLMPIAVTGTVDALNGLGMKRNTNPFTTEIPAGTYVWAGIRTAMAGAQPTLAGLSFDLGTGQILAAIAAGVLTAAGPWTGAIQAANTEVTSPMLVATLD